MFAGDVVWDCRSSDKTSQDQKIGHCLGLAGLFHVVKHGLVTLVVIIFLKDAATFEVLFIIVYSKSVLGTSLLWRSSGVQLLQSKIRQVPLFTSGGLGLGHVILVLVLVWSCLHHWCLRIINVGMPIKLFTRIYLTVFNDDRAKQKRNALIRFPTLSRAARARGKQGIARFLAA